VSLDPPFLTNEAPPGTSQVVYHASPSPCSLIIPVAAEAIGGAKWKCPHRAKTHPASLTQLLGLPDGGARSDGAIILQPPPPLPFSEVPFPPAEKEAERAEKELLEWDQKEKEEQKDRASATSKGNEKKQRKKAAKRAKGQVRMSSRLEVSHSLCWKGTGGGGPQNRGREAGGGGGRSIGSCCAFRQSC